MDHDHGTWTEFPITYYKLYGLQQMNREKCAMQHGTWTGLPIRLSLSRRINPEMGPVHRVLSGTRVAKDNSQAQLCD